jgi:hypothetical protein
MRHEHQMFFGLLACVLAAIGVVLGRKSAQWSRHVAIFTLALLALIAITLSVNGHSLYRLVMALPGFNSIRAVTRIAIVMLLPVALLSAIGVQTIAGRFPNLRTPLFLTITALLAVQLIGFQAMQVPIVKWRERLNVLTAGSEIPRSGSHPILFAFDNAPESWVHIYRELDGMVLAQDLGAPTANGYSGNLPAYFGSVDSCMTAAQRLANGAAFKRLPPSDLSDMLRRIYVLPVNADCPDFSTLKPYSGALPDSVFHNVSIAIMDQKAAGLWYAVTIQVENHSSFYLPAISTNDEAVQLSWQFVPQGRTPTEDAWTTRAPLETDIPAGGSASQNIKVAPPIVPGHYTLVFSLVQDKVAWFHEKGMKLAVSGTPIDVRSP